MSLYRYVLASRQCRIVLAVSLETVVAFGAHSAAAQPSTGAVAGMVTDASHRPLAGAVVHAVNGSGDGTAGREGAYRLTSVPAGAQRLVVRYLGYQPETLTVAIQPGRTAQADVVLRHPLQQLEAIRVESAVAGQAAALNQQRAADNVSSVVDAELVGRLPDRNLAEALGRVPGVALVRDQGEGRYVQIRGTSSTLNTLSIDGVRMPSPDPSSRQTPMDVIPSDMVAAIQVSKTLTPDMDGDAIGGNVNLVTPTPRRGMPIVALNVAGGQNRINDGALKNVSGFVGRRLGPDDRLGILLGGSYYQNDRGSQNYEMGWCVETTCRGVPTASALDAPTQLALRDYSQILRTRKGANGTLDYRFNDANALFVKGFYSKFADDEQRYVTLANFSSGTYAVADANHGTVVGARMDKELRLRPVSQSQASLQLGGTHVLGPSSTTVDYTLQNARAREDRPETLTMVWRQSSMDFAYDVSDEERPAYTVTKGAEVDPTKFAYNSLRQQTRHVLDDDRSGRLNVSQPLVLGAVHGVPVHAVLKVGGSARLKDRTSRDTSNRYLTTFKAGTAPATPVTLATLQGTSRSGHFIDDRFTFGPQASTDAVRTFWDAYRSALNVDAARSQVESNQASYDVHEDVVAGYVMASLDVGPLHLIPGARVEHTHQENMGNLVRQAGTNVTITPQTTTHAYANVLPSLTAKWSMDERTIVRGAITRSLVRPAFSDMAPIVNVPDGSNVVAAIGNADLKPIRALNLDLMVERYFRTVGFVSAGYFHKRLSDFIFTEQRTATAADGFGTTVTGVAQPKNAESGTLDGIEVAWQQNLPMLPGVLSGLGFNANYTRTTSSTTFPSRAGTTSRLPGQAGNAANLGLFYERSRVALRVGYNFADRYLEVIGTSALTDIYVASRGQLDASGSVQLVRQAKLFVETNNLTNQPLRRYIGRSERSWQPGDEYYRSWGMIGVRVQP